MTAESRQPARQVRLRLSRKRGFKLQKLSRDTNGREAVVVSRPSRWGNPFPVKANGRERAIALYEAHLRKTYGKRLGKALQPLHGKNLACWCAHDLPCHADLLLRLANDPSTVGGA
jgi:hypothetical protein